MDNGIVYFREFQANTLENYKTFCPVNSFFNESNASAQKNENGKFYTDTNQIIDNDEVKTYYGDRTKGLTILHCQVKVMEIGDKISLRYTYTVRKRRVGRQFFSVSKTHRFVTYNTKSKNFYHGVIETTKKTIKKKKVRCNTFYLPFLTEIKLSIRRNINHISSQTKSWKSLVSTKDRQMTLGDDVSEEILKTFAYAIYHKNNILFNYDSNYLEGEVFKMYLKDNGIAFPNSVNQYTVIKVPKRELKKHGNIIHYFMTISKVKGKKVREILNKSKNIDFTTVVEVFHNMGVDYFNLIDSKFFESENFNLYHAYFNSNTDFTNVKIFELNNTDKKRIVKLINMDNEVSWTMIKNHLHTLVNLKKFGEDYKMKFMNRDEFNEEHYRITELLESYREGKIIRYYGDEFKKFIEEVITVNDIVYVPSLLLTSSQYNEESKTQSNCVRTYVDICENFIVSLRKGNKFSSDRITVEYSITKDGLVRVQNRKKFNQSTDEEDDVILQELDKRVQTAFRKKIFNLPIIKKEFTNGRFIERYAIFDDKEYIPSWNKSLDIERNPDLPF